MRSLIASAVTGGATVAATAAAAPAQGIALPVIFGLVVAALQWLAVKVIAAQAQLATQAEQIAGLERARTEAGPASRDIARQVADHETRLAVAETQLETHERCPHRRSAA